MATFSVNKMRGIIFFMLIALSGCKLDHKDKVDRSRFSFKTTADSRAFFTNVRSIYYHREIIANGEVVAFRFRGRDTDTTHFYIYPTIVLNLQTNDALLFLETASKEDTLKINIGEMELFLGDQSREEVLEFATMIYEGIMAEKNITVHNKQKLFKDDSDRENFRKVMSDYYRLTRIF